MANTGISDEIFAWLREKNNTPRSQFLLDMEIKAVNGTLTPNMVAALERSFAQDKERAAEREAREAALKDAPKLVEGRYAFIGRIKSEKWVESQFGTQHKVLIELANGNRVFGTLPAAFERKMQPVYGQPVPETVGSLIALTAAVQPKEDHFGFYSRPKLNEVVDIEGVWAEEIEACES